VRATVGRARLKTELIGAPAVGNGFVYVTTFPDTPNLFSGRVLVFPAAGCGMANCAMIPR
jgi:hypothetical protein